MKITWLGQAGLLFDNGNTKVMIDPYLSDSVEKINPANWRRVPVKKEIFDIEPDVLIFTHDHLDHYDPETAEVFLQPGRKPKTVLCPWSVWQKVRTFGGSHNYVLFDRHSQWTEFGFRFSAVTAAHSDLYAIGVVLEDLSENKTYYVTGDTVYNTKIFADLPEHIDVVFLPVNGVGNNMNAADAMRLFRRCGAKSVVAYHVGMFDELTSGILETEDKITLKIYEEKEV